jgi:hypothetical protein
MPPDHDARSAPRQGTARIGADLYVGLSRRIAWRWPADPGDLRSAFAARGRLAGCGGQCGGRRVAAGPNPVKARGAGHQAAGWSRGRSEQARHYAAECHRPSRSGESTDISPGPKGPTTLPARPATGRLLVGDAVSISPRAVAGGEASREAIVRMARRMSSRGTGRPDPARVPSAALRDRILTRSRLPVLIVLLAIGYGTAGYWLI